MKPLVGARDGELLSGESEAKKLRQDWNDLDTIIDAHSPIYLEYSETSTDNIHYYLPSINVNVGIIPFQMQTALWIHAKRAAFTLGPNTIPSPGLGEILVRLHSIALNPVDWKFQDLGWDLEYPSVFGHEGAGTVEALGAGVKQFVKGDKVLHQGTASVFEGTFQQYALVPEIIASKIPDQLSFDEATTLPLGIATAAVPLYSPAPKGLAYEAPWEDHGRGKYAGHPILILGGSSTVGQYGASLYAYVALVRL
ncbi:chaperonin 10-like protein [Hygrophoropsis aurantiaca]|uniref:Chaperonin 10-like protein n=1 Tax=Hygrophoropsis aurantiaca TaxID=72124 RepID=A0ACB8A233_9AGAM|nr:chaperonin 10-like protein [Hygrophoropsis aurantiaca]